MAFTPVPTPTVNRYATVNPPVPLKQDSELKTKQAMKACLQMTSESAQILASPQFSALVQGIKMMGEPSGGFMGGMNQGLGFLMIMASPVWGIIRVGIGLPGTVIGLAGTAGSALAMPLEKGINLIKDAKKPSEVDEQREHLTNAFVEKMKQILPVFSYPQQCAIRKNPEELIYIGGLSVAFLSRNVGQDQLKVGNDILKGQALAKQDDTVKEYFRLVNETKDVIKSLNLSEDDEIAWNDLRSSLETIDKGSSDNSTTVKLETVGLIMQYIVQFGQLAINDPLFKNVWKSNFPEFN